ncbi:MAG: hypothetical protein V4721_00715 [Bacteroidota bacterium]
MMSKFTVNFVGYHMRSRQKRPAIGLLLILLVVFGSCHKEIQSQKEVFRSDFATPASLQGIEGGVLNNYDGKTVTGFYNNSGFTLKIPSLEKHDLILVEFDLYIHDTWGGNNTGDRDNTDGPDIWELSIDDEKVIRTTFSNSQCLATYCLQQSYPKNYPFHYDAKASAYLTNLPGRCSLVNVAGGTTLYRIAKIFNHSASNIKLEFKDLLKQNNTVDMLCDESWSLDNLSVSIITVN